ncbi:MAG: hypothetical protein ACRCXZ_09585 [Patescibacteria group bacterium]
MKRNLLIGIAVGIASTLTIGLAMVNPSHSHGRIQTAQTTTQVAKTKVDHKAIRAAVKANDFNAYKQAAGQKAKTQVEFDSMVKRQADRQVLIKKVDDAVIANDFKAYQDAVTQLKGLRKDHPHKQGKVVNLDKMQNKFNKLVQAYQKDKTLPSQMRNEDNQNRPHRGKRHHHNH